MIRRLRFFTGVKGCVSFRTRLLHGSLRLGMIGELAARRRGNQVHVIPVCPGVDCGSRALTPLLSTRFGGRKLITDAPSFGMTLQLQADVRHAMGQGIDGTPLLPLRGNDRACSTDSVVVQTDSILHAVSATEGSRALRSLSRARSMQRTARASLRAAGQEPVTHMTAKRR